MVLMGSSLPKRGYSDFESCCDMEYNTTTEINREIEANKILLVDDDPVTNFLNTMVVNQFCNKATIEVLENALNVLEVYEQFKPDLIFLDINMPLIDGWAVLQLFKENNIAPVVFMLSSSISKIDKERAFEYPFVQGFISKPLTKKIMDELIAGKVLAS